MSPEKRRVVLRAVGVFVILFGLLTLKEGGSVAFDIGTARASHGNYVPFVLWFNFLSGLVYIAAGVGLVRERRWGALLAIALVAGIGLTYLAFGVHVLRGGLYERSTIGAMALRLTVWLVTALLACRWLGCRPKAAATAALN